MVGLSHNRVPSWNVPGNSYAILGRQGDHRMLPRNPWLLLLPAIALLGAGCSDDGTTPGDDQFKVTITVVDGAGQPVPNLDLALVSDNDFLQDKGAPAEPGPEKARAGIQFVVPVPSRVTLYIRDIEGRPVRTLLSETFPAGVHSSYWDGKNDAGDHQMSGRYTVYMTLLNEEEILIGEASVDILMALLGSHPVGTTDANGRITLTDQRLFPHLYEREPITAMNESGEEIGMIELDETMIFNFYSQDEVQWQRFYGDVAGAGGLQFVWDPAEKTESEALAFTGNDGIGVPPIPTGPDLVVFPNPFN